MLNQHIDNADDGFNNGTVGIHHVFSHDNGTTGDGSGVPPAPTVRQQGLAMNAYVLMRTGPSVLFYNAGQFTSSGRSYYPRGGLPSSLGVDATGDPDPALTTLLRLRGEYCRGELHVINGTDPVNQSLDDVIVIERRKALSGGGYSGNVLVGMNDRWDAGVDVRSVQTTFPVGTRLHELTGNATDAFVDPTDQVSDVLVVDSNQRVLITVPRNASTSGEHGRGYVVYGPVVPSGTLGLTNVSSTIAPDGSGVPLYARRNTSIPVVTGNFNIQLTTTAADPCDPDTDDFAVFRIDAGFVDYNASGGVDFAESDAFIPGYENFVTVNQPLYGTAGPNGHYSQAITASQLAEGMHYLSVIAFRHRPSGTDPLWSEFRQVFYVDREPPAIELIDPPTTLEVGTATFRIRALDATTDSVHAMLDVPTGVDPLTLVDGSNHSYQYDRFEWRHDFSGIANGPHTLTVVAFEPSGNAAILTHNFQVGDCPADLNGDNTVDLTDLGLLLAHYGQSPASYAEGDLDNNNVVDLTDLGLLLANYGTTCP